jgi:hypothetical protein
MVAPRTSSRAWSPARPPYPANSNMSAVPGLELQRECAREGAALHQAPGCVSPSRSQQEREGDGDCQYRKSGGGRDVGGLEKNDYVAE